jgi:carbonic anhydrase/acetyltransferase-like protein (isoleucine patch superfamily)
VALIRPFNGKWPRVADDAFLAPTAVLIGDVTIGAGASVWFGAVLRGDDPDNGIVVGVGSSIQDNCVVHVGDWGPTVVGEHVTVGHGAKFESCSIGDRSIVGMNAVILQEAVIGAECVVAANAVVLEGARIPDRSLVAGVPGRIKKQLDGSAAEWVSRGGRHYVQLAEQYRSQGIGDSGSACELCGGPAIERNCKIICLKCGYQRDCSDP